jgi:nucleotide-binding universal stress UspA family protein
MQRLGFIPLLTYPDAMSDTAAIASVRMGAALNLHLDVSLYNVELPRSGSSITGIVIGMSDIIQKVENDSRDHCARLSAAVESAARERTCVLTVETCTATPAGAIAAAVDGARYRDLTLLPWSSENLTAREVAEAVIFGAGRPSILVPESHEITEVRHIAVAWDGSRVAARALADAQTILKDGTAITVLTVGDEKHLATGVAGRLVESLSRRGIAAKAHAVSAHGRPIAAALQDGCREIGADMLVMGGYGHSRLRDFVMGGATQGVLANLVLPVLISH